MPQISNPLFALIVFAWLYFAFFVILSGPAGGGVEEQSEIRRLSLKVRALRSELKTSLDDAKALRLDIGVLERKLQTANSSELREILDGGRTLSTLPVLVFACNCPSVRDHIDQLMKYRPSETRFPIVVSQDCGDSNTKWVLEQYGDDITLLLHPNLTDIPLQGKAKKFKGYYKLSRHYKWALNHVFRVLNFSHVIITEDDLNIAPDFFEYFEALAPMLYTDPRIWCISAWNDNGKDNLTLHVPEMLHRTDFFPGLGWMLTKEVWFELEAKWPVAFWDDWMRQAGQRRDRQCIRPEVSRTSIMLAGKKGASSGQFYEKHLKFIHESEKFVRFSSLDLSYLNYDIFKRNFHKAVKAAAEVTLEQVKNPKNLPDEEAYRLVYNDKKHFKTIAKNTAIMDDFKDGVARGAFDGVVPVAVAGRRLYISPPADWTGYDTSWS